MKNIIIALIALIFLLVPNTFSISASVRTLTRNDVSFAELGKRTSSCDVYILFAAAAEAQWIRIERENVPILRTPTNSTEEIMFIAEYSYYLRVVGQTNLYYQVTLYDGYDGYYSVTGYVRKDETVLCQGSPVLPLYPRVSATVRATSCPIYADRNVASEILTVALRNQEVFYYGVFEGYLFCRFGDKLGYVEAELLDMPDITLHPKALSAPSIPVANAPAPQTPQAEPYDEQLSPVLFLVPLAVVLAILVLVVLFDKRRRT